MTRKEYKKALENMETYTGRDYLTRYEIAALRRASRERCKDGNAAPVPGCGCRATFRQVAPDHYVLTSYYTDVLEIADYEIIRLWDGVSATTLRHVDKFLQMFGAAGFSKKEWVEMPVESLRIPAASNAA